MDVFFMFFFSHKRRIITFDGRQWSKCTNDVKVITGGRTIDVFINIFMCVWNFGPRVRVASLKNWVKQSSSARGYETTENNARALKKLILYLCVCIKYIFFLVGRLLYFDLDVIVIVIDFGD